MSRLALEISAGAGCDAVHGRDPPVSARTRAIGPTRRGERAVDRPARTGVLTIVTARAVTARTVTTGPYAIRSARGAMP